MSDAAKKCVEAFFHHEVKGGARRLLEVIATQIPEGQTMTPEITIPELAALMGYGDNAARRGRRDLVKVGVVQIVDGGQGQVSRYELMLLPDARADDPALPLIGATPPPTPPRMRPPRRNLGPDLFDLPAEGERITDNIDQNDRSWSRYFDHFDRCSRWVGAVLRSIWAMLVRNFDHFDRSSLPLGGTRARATYNNLRPRTTTTAAPPAESPPAPVAQAPPCRWFGKSHAWCNGRVHVPRDFHLEERRKLGRHPGETDAELDAQLFRRYAKILAAIPETEALPSETEFAFWKRVLRSPAVTSQQARAPTLGFRSLRPHTPRDGVTGSNCRHDPRCARTADCLARTIAEARAERQEQSG